MDFPTIVGAFGILAALSGVAGLFFQHFQHLAAYRPNKDKYGERRNTMMVAGIGRVGKTFLIQRITSPEKDIFPDPTEEYCEYSCQHENNDGSIARLFFSDYRGQTFGQLVSSFLERQLVPGTYFRFGDINSLLIIVDFFKYNLEEELEERRTREIIKHDYPHEERIRDHLEAWNENSLDALFGMHTVDSLKYVCLFINKLDKWTHANEPGAVEKLKEMFAPLSRRIEPRVWYKHEKTGVMVHYADFEVLVGSATNPPGDLLIKLYHHSYARDRK